MKRKYQPKKLEFLIQESGRTAFELAREAKCMGSKLDRASISRHAAGLQVPSAITLGVYADLFQVTTEFFFEVI